ncbi:MAG: hypothetical protein RBS38_14455 [Bacteroidales bacterium]|nr:hypothetical protein [Bacteroidales bacterium]
MYGNFTLGFDWKILYTKMSAGSVLSEGNGTYLQMRNSRYFQTPAFADGKAYISFDPYVNMLFGTLTRTITADGTTIGISRPFGSGKAGRNSTQNTTTYFGLMELDMGIPVSLNAGSFTLEAETGYVFTLYSDAEAANPKGFIFMVNCYYKIF